nr:DUF3060 domain-containing protein [Roseomonas acroporae]
MAVSLPIPALHAQPQAEPPEAIRIVGANARREVNCEGRDVDVAGTSHVVTLLGACGRVTVQGSRHQVRLGSAASLDVYGEGQQVQVQGQSGSLVVAGANHRVATGVGPGTTPGTSSGSPGGPASVEVSGAGSVIHLRLSGPTRIEVAGARHRVFWTAPAGVPEPEGSNSGIDNTVRRGDG